MTTREGQNYELNFELFWELDMTTVISVISYKTENKEMCENCLQSDDSVEKFI